LTEPPEPADLAGLAPEQRIARLGIEIPRPQTPLAQHLPVVVSGNFAFISGHGPMDSERNPVFTGAVGDRYTIEDGVAAARLSALNAISSLRLAVGSLDRVTRVVKLTGLVLSAPGFERQPWVIDGASAVLVEVFGPRRGSHARTSVGVGSSSLSLTVTVEVIVEVTSA
jgi:enamine deaminase RidA (YjgF/YER057c/UK114 family)